MTGKPPYASKGLDHLLLKVRGLEAAIEFYGAVAGCDLRSRLPQHGMAELSGGLDLVYIAAAEGAWAREGAGEGANVHHFCLSLAAVKETDIRQHLQDSRVAIEEERLEGGRLSLYVRDPSGNQVELRFSPL